MLNISPNRSTISLRVSHKLTGKKTRIVDLTKDILIFTISLILKMNLQEPKSSSFFLISGVFALKE